MSVTRAALIGATGRMGTAIVRASVAGKLLEVAAAIASPDSKSAGLDIGEVAGGTALGVRVLGELPPDLAQAQVAIDFSRPELSLRALECVPRRARADRHRHDGSRRGVRGARRECVARHRGAGRA